MKALFLRHEGYLGALGTFLINAELFLKESNRNTVNFGVSRDGGFEDKALFRAHFPILGYVRDNFLSRVKKLFRTKEFLQGDLGVGLGLGVVVVGGGVLGRQDADLSARSKGGLVRNNSSVKLQYDSDDETARRRGRRVGDVSGPDVNGGSSSMAPSRGRNNTYDEEDLRKARASLSVSASSSPISGNLSSYSSYNNSNNNSNNNSRDVSSNTTTTINRNNNINSCGDVNCNNIQ